MIATVIAGPDQVIIRMGETFARRFQFGTEAAEFLRTWLVTGQLEGHDPEALTEPLPRLGVVCRLDRDKPDMPKFYRMLCQGPRSAIALAYRLSWRLDVKGAV